MSEKNRKSHKYSVLGPGTLAFLIAFVIGCTKADKAQSADTTVPVAVADPGLANDPGLDDVPGRDTAKTRAYLATLQGQWTARPESVTLHCDTGECAGNPTVHLLMFTHPLTLKIEAAKIVDKNTPESAQNIRGQIVAKIVNRDAFPYEPLRLAPNDTAYLWAGKTDRHRAFAVFRIDAQGNAKGLSRAFRGITCEGRPEQSSNVHIVPKNSCETGRARKELYFHADIMPAGLKDSPNSVTPPGQIGPLHNQGVWFSCSGGCCQASTFGPY